MTNTIIHYDEESLRQLSNQKLLSLIKEIDVDFNYLNGHLKKFHRPLYNELLHRTKFLDDFYEERNKCVPIPARLYCLEHNLSSHPTCQNPNCPTHSKVEWNRTTRTFRQYCCHNCHNSDPFYQEKMQKHFMKTLGVPYPLMSKVIQKQTQDSIRRNNGGIGFQSKLINQKIKARNKDLYGNEYIAKTKHWKQKVKETCNKNWDSDSPFGSEIIQQKCQQTCMKNLGVPYPLMSKEIISKTQQSMIQSHGGLGLSVEGNKQKAISTCNERYNVDWFQQSNEAQLNRKHKFTSPKYPEITFDSNWEIMVYDFLTEHNISFEYQPTISFPYEYKGTHHTYHPDFRVGNKIIEVKGDHFFRINESTGQEEMYCPYKRPEWSDEYYEWKCGLYEAKHQCMIANNVVILRSNQLNNMYVEFFTSNSLL